jgi:hypothetical protein
VTSRTPVKAELTGGQPSGMPRHASPLTMLCTNHDISNTTMWEMRKAGRGPKVFKIGKKLYATHDNFAAWLDQLAAESTEG